VEEAEEAEEEEEEDHGDGDEEGEIKEESTADMDAEKGGTGAEGVAAGTSAWDLLLFADCAIFLKISTLAGSMEQK